jgi:hypothetical protein
MATSGTYSFTCNRDQIIRDAMLNIAKLDEIEGPTPQETIDCAFKLNMLVKQWMGTKDFAPGLKEWTQRRGFLYMDGRTGKYSLSPTSVGWTNTFNSTTTMASVSSGSIIAVTSSANMTAGDNIGLDLDIGYIYWSTIAIGGISGNNITIAGTVPSLASKSSIVYSYTTGAQQPLEVRTAFLRDSFYSDTPLKLMTSSEYDYLPNKTDPNNLSDPTAIYYEWQLAQGNLYVDVGGAADLSKYICLTYLEETQDFNNPADAPEYPQEWFLPLTLGLAKQIAPMYRAEWTPLLQDNYTTALAIAQKKGANRETLYFQPGLD